MQDIFSHRIAKVNVLTNRERTGKHEH